MIAGESQKGKITIDKSPGREMAREAEDEGGITKEVGVSVKEVSFCFYPGRWLGEVVVVMVVAVVLAVGVLRK